MVIKCENCGASLAYDDGLKNIKCEYCGTVSSLDLLRLSLGNDPIIDNSLKMDLLKYAAAALQSGDFDEAEKLYSQYIDNNSPYAEAFTGRLLATLRLRSVEEFAYCEENFTEHDDFIKALNCADENYSQWLQSVATQGLKQISKKKKLKLYQSAKDFANQNTEDSVTRAQKAFLFLEDFEDSQYQAEHCAELLKTIVDTKPASLPMSPQAIKMVVSLFVLAFVSLLVFQGLYGVPTPVKANSVSPKSSSQSTVTTEAPIQYKLMDYRDIVANSSEYTGQYVQVAGRVSETSGRTRFYMCEGTNSADAYRGLEVSLKKESVISDGDNVIVQGRLDGYSGTNLEHAEILTIGSTAEQHARAYEGEWLKKRVAELQDTRTVDYMEILDNPEQYNNSCVRVSGTITTVNLFAEEARLASRNKRETMLIIPLESCQYPIRQLLADGMNIVVTGVVLVKDDKVNLVNCYIEALGSDADKIVNEAEAVWQTKWQEQLAALIADANRYSYEELARYPEKLKGQQVMVQGTVVSIDDWHSHDRIFLDMRGDGSGLVYIEYNGRVSIDEPLMLQGDKVTFYGSFDGMKSYYVGDDKYEKSLYITSTVKR